MGTLEQDPEAAAARAPAPDHSEGDPDASAHEAQPTRERILDVALGLFIEKGFDATSLQEVADELGLTKAALYYHYRSKEDILMALHMRMHQFGRQRLDQLVEGPVTLELWESLLSSLIGEMVKQRPLFLMHERNQAALERLHRQEHEAMHDDLHSRLRLVLSDPSIPLRDRVRMACSLGAVFGILFVAGDLLEPGSEEVVPLLQDAIHSLLAP